jgi:hypothetical protein
MEPALHPDVEPLAFLLGTWRGEGEGEWPVGESFRYGEEMTFEHVGDAFLLYLQRSWLLEDGSPLHFERGFLRRRPPAASSSCWRTRSGSPRSPSTVEAPSSTSPRPPLRSPDRLAGDRAPPPPRGARRPALVGSR